MPKIKISELDSSAALTGNEELPVVQTGTTFKTTAQDIADLALPYKHYAVLLSYETSFFGDVFTVGQTRINQIGDGSGDGINDISWSYSDGAPITASMTTGDVFLQSKLIVTVNPVLSSAALPIIFNVPNTDITSDDTKLYIRPINATNGSNVTGETWSTIVDIKRFY